MAVNIKNISLPEASPGATGRFAHTLSQVSNVGSSASTPEVKQLAREFTSLLMLEMLKSMRATLSEEGLDGDKSSVRDTYSSLADVEVTRSLVKHDKMGLAAFLEHALSRALTEHDPFKAESTPSTGEVTSTFGLRSDLFVGEEHFHKSIDIAAPEGSPIKAAEAGTVVFSG